MLTPDTPPPEDYYQNNCSSLFNFVLEHDEGLLDENVSGLLRAYSVLSHDGQRLFARLLTRKGPLIRVDSLNYTEIDDISGALQELTGAGFINLNPAAPADQILSLLRKAELVASVGAPRSLSKPAMLEWLVTRYTDRQMQRNMSEHVQWIGVAQPRVWWLVRLLFFGDTAQDWSAFVIRDLGMVSYEPVPMRARRFNTPAELADDLHYRELSRLSKRIDEHPALAGELVDRLGSEVADRFVQSRRERTLLRIGRWYERADAAHDAVNVYRRVSAHPARERIVRTLHRNGEVSDAKHWLQAIYASPFSEEEAQFAERFGKRKAGYQPPVTHLDIGHARADIEQQALELLLEPGEWGAHVENSLVRSLTGLVYWQAIFADVPGAFSNPFQFGPNDLYREDFVDPRLDLIQAIEERFADDQSLSNHLLSLAVDERGVANSLINWQLFDDIPIAQILDAMPVQDIRRLAHFLIRNLHARRAGLPDLFVVHGPKEYEFVEVKGPNDQLQPGQRVWFKHLERLGIPSRILKLRLAA